jgi:LacI family transcriptional regulator
MHKPRVEDQIAAALRRRIADGVYAPGVAMPTERDFAREFSTSRTTISRAFRRLEQMGLIDQAPGRGTRVIPVRERSAMGAVGIIVAGGMPEQRAPARIVHGMEEALARHGQHFQLALDLKDPAQVTAAMIAERYAGALFVQGLGFEPLLPELEARRYPHVVANLEKRIDATCTWVDHRKTTRTAVRVLTAMGHRRIVLLTRPPELFFYAEALQGFKDGLADAGVPFDEEMALVSPPADALGAYLRMRERLDGRPPPTGVVAGRDYLAQGAAKALEERGLTIGRDVSLIGFDDVSWPQSDDFLTTFAEPSAEMGAAAAEMLVDRLINGWRPPERREIGASLILRRSVGPCPDRPAPGPRPPLRLVAHVGNFEDTAR